jgi:YVTN family beta-propeller protein
MLGATVGRALVGLRWWGRWGLGSSALAVAAVTGLMAGLVLPGVPAAVASGGASPYTVLNVAVGSAPDAVAVDENTDTVYAANAQADTVSVIDGATNAVTATVAVGANPYGVAVDEDTDTVYVANVNQESGTVSVIDGATCNSTDQAGCSQTPATIAVATPDGVAVDEATDTVYVTDLESGTVSVIDGATNIVTATVAVGTEPESVAVDETTDTVYVDNEYSGTVSVIDGATNTVTATVTVGTDDDGVAVDEATDTVYVANGESSSVSVIDGATNTVTATVPTFEDSPIGVAVDEATDTVYVANYLGYLSVIDGATNTLTTTVLVGSNTDPDAVAVDENTDTIFVTDIETDTVSVIIPASLSVSPTSSHAGKSVTVSGQGFNPGETVKIIYKTGLASPKSVTICSATAGSNTSYTCSGTIPPTATAGAHAAHKILAKGLTSLIKVKTTFTLT